jgi:hypothetical protein
MFNFSYTSLTGGLPQSLPELLRPAVIFLGTLGVAFVIIAGQSINPRDRIRASIL